MWENDLWTVRFPYLSVILQEGKWRWRKMLTLPCWCGFVWQLRFLFLFWFAWQVWHWVLRPDQQGRSPPWPYRDPYAHHARSVTPSQMTLSQYGHGEHGKVSVHHLLWFHVFPFTFMFLFFVTKFTKWCSYPTELVLPKLSGVLTNFLHVSQKEISWLSPSQLLDAQ